MKTRTWILIFLTAALIFFALGIYLLLPKEACLTAEVYSHGSLIKTVSLLEDQSFAVSDTHKNTNIITVSGGKIAVTEASCPDHVCMKRGFCSSGSPIICLPNALEIRFVSSAQPDISTH